MENSFNLERFENAQESVYQDVLDELRLGMKTSHWMWYVFPQIRGLGESPTAKKYAIAGLEEAQAYLKHPLLGRRLIECTRLVIDIEGRTIQEIFGYPDFLKFRSCMTLFAAATNDNELFLKALEIYFDGRSDSLSLEALEKNRQNDST